MLYPLLSSRGALGDSRFFVVNIVLQGIKFAFDVGRHLQLVSQEPHHDDAQNPPQNLPDPDRRHAVGPGCRFQWITEDRVAEHTAGTDGKKVPAQGDDPAPFS